MFHARRSLAPLAALVPLVACSADPPPASYEPKPVPTAADSIREAAVSGTIHGQPFSLAEARVYVDQRPGHEKTDVVLSAAATPEHCGDLGPLHATTVWLRRNGPQGPANETVHLAPGDESLWDVHYEVFDDGRWTGNGHSAALIAIDGHEGRVAACFGDATGSCVEGNFSAVWCPIRIDSLVRGSPALESLPGGASHPASWPTPSSSATASESGSATASASASAAPEAPASAAPSASASAQP